MYNLSVTKPSYKCDSSTFQSGRNLREKKQIQHTESGLNTRSCLTLDGLQSYYSPQINRCENQKIIVRSNIESELWVTTSDSLISVSRRRFMKICHFLSLLFSLGGEFRLVWRNLQNCVLNLNFKFLLGWNLLRKSRPHAVVVISWLQDGLLTRLHTRNHVFFFFILLLGYVPKVKRV